MTAIAEDARLASTDGPPAGRSASARTMLGAAALVAVASALIAAVPLVFSTRFYYSDDTQAASVGMWFHMGQRLVAGELSWLDPTMWATGNSALDAQQGLFSPILLAVSWIAFHSANLGIFATALKISLLVIASVGIFLAASTYVSVRWAAVVGVAVPLNGVTMFIDAPSWVVLLFTLALLPYLWWALRRIGRYGPLPAIAIGLLLVGIGFAQSLLMLAIVGLAVAFDYLRVRDWRALTSTALVGAAMALFALVVFLPGARSAYVTFRTMDSLASNDEVLTGGLDFLSVSPLVTARAAVAWFWGPVAATPLAYVCALLALLAFVPWRPFIGAMRSRMSVVIVAITAFVLFAGPAMLGPSRWPLRYYPLVALALLIIMAVGFDTATRHGWRVSRGRIVAAAVVLAWAGHQSFSNFPDALLKTGFGVVVTAALLSGVVLLSRRPAFAGTWRLPAAMIASLLVLTVAQHASYRTPATPDFEMPAKVADLAAAQSQAVAPSMVVGAARSTAWEEGFVADEMLLGNAWLVGNSGQINLYNFLERRGYNDLLCVNYHGTTCPEALTVLFTPQPTTGLLAVDQLGLNTLVVTNDVAERAEELLPSHPADGIPAGWSVVEAGRVSETWVRDTPASCADGGVLWTSVGVEVETVSLENDAVTVRVLSAPADGGTVAFCRMQWPGFESTSGEVLAIDDYLLGVAVSADDIGSDVSVEYAPPGAALMRAGGAGVLVVTVGALAWWLIGNARDRRRRTVGVGGAA